MFVDECLYKHFQEEKRKRTSFFPSSLDLLLTKLLLALAWFKQMPPAGLKSGQVMYQIGDREAEVWDENGQVVFRTNTDNS